MLCLADLRFLQFLPEVRIILPLGLERLLRPAPRRAGARPRRHDLDVQPAERAALE
eukprot:SAG22_NODE_563_length_9067_cov_5.039251_6_plen_56_part_00